MTKKHDSFQAIEAYFREYIKENNQKTHLPKEKPNITSNHIIKTIESTKRKIIGQKQAIESLVLNIYTNQKIIETNNPDLISTQKVSILLDGPTGTGKTTIVKEIAKQLSLPIVITSATTYTETGYVGANLTDIFETLIKKSNGNINLAQRGIICLDEIDKLAITNTNDQPKPNIQHELLSFISGTEIQLTIDENLPGLNTKKTINFDTTNITFIGIGAFTSLRENKKNIKTPGFIQSPNQEAYTITTQDYITYGLERELIGRFSLIISTKEYTKSDYINIIKNSEISPLKTFIEFTKIYGIEKVNYDEQFIESLAEEATKSNLGARGLTQIISDLKNSLLISMLNNPPKEITLTSETINQTKQKTKRKYK